MRHEKTISRIAIMNHIFQFSLATNYGGKIFGELPDMGFFNDIENQKAQPGDLVVITSAPASKWYLGWLVSRQRLEGFACEQFTIESIEDGQLCNWANIGLKYYDRSQTSSHPEWRWTDAQHRFKDRWFRTAFRKRKAYWRLPKMPIFKEDGSVTLGLRTRFGEGKDSSLVTFPDFRKVTIAKMLAVFDKLFAEMERQPTTRETA